MTRNQTNHRANDRTNHRSFRKFRGTVKIPCKRQIPWLGLKFCGKLWGLSIGTSGCECQLVFDRRL